MDRAPDTHGVVETGVYVEDLDRALAFYAEVLGLRPLFSDRRMAAMDAGGNSLLLLFLRGAAAEGIRTEGLYIPPHDGHGPVHFALAVGKESLEAWRTRLLDKGVAIESEVEWSRGGRSLYFRDPDGHSVELVTPGTWEVY